MSRRHRWKQGAAALEFALTAPLLIFIGSALLDAAYAFSLDVQVNSAATIASVYCLDNTKSTTTTAGLRAIYGPVPSIVQHSWNASAPVTTQYNYNEPLSQGQSQYDTTDKWCIASAADPASAVWTVSTGATCPGQGQTTPGVFVVINVSTPFTPIFGYDQFLFKGLTLSSTAIVRVP